MEVMPPPTLPFPRQSASRLTMAGALRINCGLLLQICAAWCRRLASMFLQIPAAWASGAARGRARVRTVMYVVYEGGKAGSRKQ